MSEQYEVALFAELPTDPLYADLFQVVRLSDAEAIIAQKDAEIERLKAMLPDIQKAERECKTLEDWRFRALYFESEYMACSHGFNSHASKQAERIKELESEDSKIHQLKDETIAAQGDEIAKQSAALKLAKDAFSAINTEAKAFMSYENARNNFSDDTDERKAYERAMLKGSELTKKALAAIDALGE